MNKNKRLVVISIITILIVSIFTIVLTSCNNVTASTPASAFLSEISGGNIDEFTYYKILLDKETGVEYVYIYANYKSSMTPRYNTDGSLYIYGGEDS